MGSCHEALCNRPVRIMLFTLKGVDFILHRSDGFRNVPFPPKKLGSSPIVQGKPASFGGGIVACKSKIKE